MVGNIIDRKSDAGEGESSHPHERWTAVEYARFAEDLVILVDAHPRQPGLGQASGKAAEGEVGLNCRGEEEQSRKVDLQRGESFRFLALSSIAFGVAGGEGCRCWCRKARTERPCLTS